MVQSIPARVPKPRPVVVGSRLLAWRLGTTMRSLAQSERVFLNQGRELAFFVSYGSRGPRGGSWRWGLTQDGT